MTSIHISQLRMPWAPPPIERVARRAFRVTEEMREKMTTLAAERDHFAAEADRWSKAFRRERGRVAGLRSVEVKKQRRIAELEAAVAEMSALLDRPRPNHPNADLIIAKLFQDLRHAVDCLSPECKRCDLIQRRIEDGAAHYVEEGEVADQLEYAERLCAMGRAVFLAAKDRSVGSQARYREALTALLACVRECGADDE